MARLLRYREFLSPILLIYLSIRRVRSWIDTVYLRITARLRADSIKADRMDRVFSSLY